MSIAAVTSSHCTTIAADTTTLTTSFTIAAAATISPSLSANHTVQCGRVRLTCSGVHAGGGRRGS